MKILSANTGYFLGYGGAYTSYVKHPARAVIGSRREEEHLQKFLELVEREDPDVILLQEVDDGSIRTRKESQHQYLSERLPGYEGLFGTKYRGTVTPRLPMLRKLGNSVFYRNGEAENHRLNAGRKNLVQEVRTEDLNIYSLHLATAWQRTRRKQLEELEEITGQRERYTVAGDYNFLRGEKEIQSVEDMNGWTVRSPGPTFPASNPDQRLDLVSAPEDVQVENLERLENTFTDHRPITFEI